MSSTTKLLLVVVTYGVVFAIGWPSVLEGLRGGSPVVPGFFVAVLVLSGLMLVASVLAAVFGKKVVR